MGDAQLLRDLVQALAGAPVTLNLLDDPLIQLRSAVACARSSGFGDARAHAFGDERPLKFGDRRDDGEHGLTHRDEVSICSVIEIKSTPRWRNSSSASMSCLVERAKRSNFHTRMVS